MLSHTFPSFSSHLSLFSLGPFPSQFSCLNWSFLSLLPLSFFNLLTFLSLISVALSLAQSGLLCALFVSTLILPPFLAHLYPYSLLPLLLHVKCLLFILCLLYPSVSVFFYLHTLITLSSSFPKSASASVGIGLFIYSMSLMAQRYSNPLLSPQSHCPQYNHSLFVVTVHWFWISLWHRKSMAFMKEEEIKSATKWAWKLSIRCTETLIDNWLCSVQINTDTQWLYVELQYF